MTGIDIDKILQLAPSPAYVVDLGRLRHNLAILGEVQRRSGAKILLALKAFALVATDQRAFSSYGLPADGARKLWPLPGGWLALTHSLRFADLVVPQLRRHRAEDLDEHATPHHRAWRGRTRRPHRLGRTCPDRGRGSGAR